MSRITLNSRQSVDADLITGHEIEEMDDGTYELRLFLGAGFGLHRVRVACDQVSTHAWEQLAALDILPPEGDG